MIDITSEAAEQLKSILQEEGEETSALRVIVMPGGNGGVQYMLSLESDVREDDVSMDTDGIKVVVDSYSVPLLEGAKIDYVNTLMRSGFVISNPNFVGGGGGCGCGGGGGGCGGGGGACGCGAEH